MKLNTSIKKVLKENEIELIRRTKENYTHEALQDANIEEITTWKTSEKKLGHYYLYVILSCGIVHIISKFNPLLFIKLYCIPCIPKEADYFLVKDIYGEYDLCIKESKRNNPKKTNGNITDDLSNENILGITTNNDSNLTNQIVGFNYNSKFYEYNESMNKIIPIFFDLNNLSNKRIYQLFIEGLSTQTKVNKFKERYGLNICPFNNKLIILYFLKAELYLLIISIIIGIIEAILGNKFYFILIMIFIAINFIYQYILIRRITLDKEPTLEGQKKQIKVKRKFMNEKDNDYCFINNIDLLPGDIIYLKKDENVPCDGIILEGECIIGLSSVNGTISEFRKKELDNNSNHFNYRANKNSILYHGTKILKSFSKLENNSILLLCINTGSNTYKANQLINIIYLFKRNKKYSEIYSNFCGKKKKLIVHMFFTFIFSSIAVILIFYFIESNKNYKKLFTKKLFSTIIKFLARCFLPIYHIVSSGIIFIGTLHLLRDNIKCHDKSRLLYAGNINTIFFDKTGTLTEKNLEIVGFLPSIVSPNSSDIFLKFYNISHIKELTSLLINYYSNYNQEEEQFFNNDNVSYSNIYDKEKRVNDIPKKMAVLFLECMISCNNLEKINNQIYGNSIEKEIISQLKWEMKINLDENQNQYKKHLYTEENKENMYNNESYPSFKTNNCIYEQSEKHSKNKTKILEQKLDLYPKNYYKITEGKKNGNIKNSNNYFDNNMNSSKDLMITSHNSKLNDLSDYSEKENKKYYQRNQIIDDIIQNDNNNSYKLRVYKRYIKVGTLYSSAIVYNPIMKTLHFMTKGPPEKILPCCNYNSLPKNINKIISSSRKNGYINLILASKIISEYYYDKTIGEDFYMFNLNFCGIIILKNKLKKNIKQVIQQLKNLKCDLILNTGDNIYNSLAASYESGLTSSKNIYVFDLNKVTKKITVTDFNDILRNLPVKSNSSNIDKVSSNNYRKKKTNMRMISSRKNNFLSNKLEKMNSNLGKENSKKIEESNSKIKLPNPNYTDKIKKMAGKDDIPSLKLDQMNMNSSLNTNTKNKSKNFWKSDEKNSNLDFQIQSINSKNELIEKTINENQTENNSNNLNLITNTNKSNIINNQSFSSSIKKGQIAIKSRASAVLSHLNKSLLSQNEERQISRKQIDNSMVSIRRKETKNASSYVINNIENSNNYNYNNYNNYNYNNYNNKLKINIDYTSSKLKSMRNDCVYCISGRALRFIYENRTKPEFKKYEFPILLNHIKKFGKIFYEMKSKDKSFLIDYYRKFPNKITCMVGDGQNDIDAIMSSHVGINIKPPINRNTLFCHFHPVDGNLFCIEKIIRAGRVTFENIYLLAVSSSLCAMILISYILALSYYNIELNNTEFDFISCNYFLLSIFAFTVKPDISIKSSPLFHDSSLYKKFYMVICVFCLIINFAYEYLFTYIFTYNKDNENEQAKQIFATYYHFFCYFQIIGIIFTINSINYYRIPHRNNYLFCIVLIFIILFLSFLFLVCEYSFHPFLYNVLIFEYSPKNVDTFDDKNKLLCFIIYMADFITYFFFVFINYSIFYKKAKAKKENI